MKICKVVRPLSFSPQNLGGAEGFQSHQLLTPGQKRFKTASTPPFFFFFINKHIFMVGGTQPHPPPLTTQP